jgi:hypothetical protein
MGSFVQKRETDHPLIEKIHLLGPMRSLPSESIE